MPRFTFPRSFLHVLSQSQRDRAMPPLDKWSTTGDAHFRDIGADVTGIEERYGFRAFQVMATVSRPTVTIAGTQHRGLLRLTDHPMNGRLTSLYREYLYAPGINIAACQPYGGRRHTSAPHHMDDGKPHGCGFYAYSASDHPDAQPPKNIYSGSLAVYARAVCAGSGRRIVGTKGFLSEKLRIIAVALPLSCSLTDSHKGEGQHTYDLFGPQLERLVQANYPDVAFFNSVERMLHEFPLTPSPERTAA